MTITKSITLALPGVVFLGDEAITLSVYREKDTPAHRWRYNVRGHDVQIVRDDAGGDLTVFVDEKVAIVPMSELKAHVARVLKNI
jgi:hypothetical protein